MQSFDLMRAYRSMRVRKIEAGGAWFAIFFSRDAGLLFSWDAEWHGLCEVEPGDVRELQAGASSRPPIADALRAHLVGAELVGAETPRRDRVLMLSFRRAVGAGAHSSRGLALEVAGRYSNASLLDEEGRVIECAKHIYPDQNRYRSTAPGVAFEMPPPIDGVPLEEFDAGAPDALARLGDVVGIGRPLIAAIQRGGPALARGLSFFTEHVGDASYQLIKNYLAAYPMPLPGAVPVRAASSLDAARSVVVLALIERQVASRRRRIAAELSRQAASVDRKIADCRRQIDACAEADDMIATGRLILANASSIPHRAESARLVEWTEEGERSRVVALDPMLSPSANAERWFARARKRRAAADRAERELPKLAADQARIDEQAALIECHTSVATLAELEAEVVVKPAAKRTPKASLPPHGRRSFDEIGATIFWGLSSRGNRCVTFDLARPDDMWLHAQSIPGAHVIIRFDRMPDEAAYDRAVALGASCASHFSRARGQSVRVDLTERKHVRAIPGGGGAHVTYKNFSTVTADGSSWLDAQ